MIYEKRKLTEIKLYKNNPRINDEAVKDCEESIKQCGYIAPIVVDENNVILAGHTRAKALRNLGIKECNVICAKGLTEEQKKKFRLYDNKTAELATWDMKKLEEELEDVDFMGYDFGQPKKKEETREEQQKENTVTCPCCGEVFEVWN